MNMALYSCWESQPVARRPSPRCLRWRRSISGDVSTMKLETALQISHRWNPEEPSQFFWVDDAFGVLQYELSPVLDWNRVFPKVKAMINAGARIVLTSRDYIYNRAKQNLKESAFPLMHESQVVINVRDITIEERKQILYNHIKLGEQPREFRRAIKPHLEDIASHPRFIPETARRLGDPLFTRGLSISYSGLMDFVERQEQLLQEVIQGLDKHSQASLALIFMRNGRAREPRATSPRGDFSANSSRKRFRGSTRGAPFIAGRPYR